MTRRRVACLRPTSTIPGTSWIRHIGLLLFLVVKATTPAAANEHSLVGVFGNDSEFYVIDHAFVRANERSPKFYPCDFETLAARREFDALRDQRLIWTPPQTS